MTGPLGMNFLVTKVYWIADSWSRSARIIVMHAPTIMTKGFA